MNLGFVVYLFFLTLLLNACLMLSYFKVSQVTLLFIPAGRPWWKCRAVTGQEQVTLTSRLISFKEVSHVWYQVVEVPWVCYPVKKLLEGKFHYILYTLKSHYILYIPGQVTKNTAKIPAAMTHSTCIMSNISEKSTSPLRNKIHSTIRITFATITIHRKETGFSVQIDLRIPSKAERR